MTFYRLRNDNIVKYDHAKMIHVRNSLHVFFLIRVVSA